MFQQRCIVPHHILFHKATKQFTKKYFILFQECFIHVVQPILLGYLIEHFARMKRLTTDELYMFTAGVCLLAAMFVFTHHRYFFVAQRMGMRLRISCCSLIYKKVCFIIFTLFQMLFQSSNFFGLGVFIFKPKHEIQYKRNVDKVFYI